MKTIHSMYNQSYKKNRVWVLLIAILSVGLASCQSYKELEKPPQIDTEGIVRGGAQAKGDSTTIADIPWKEYFPDKYLQALIAEGLEKNLDLQIALARIKQSKASLSISRDAGDPSLSIGAEIDHARTSSGDDGKKVLGYTTNQNSLGFVASWEIDLWGKLNSSARAEYANYLNSREYKNLVQTELIANIATAYYNLLALDKKLQVTEETVVLLKKSTETMEALKEAGQQNAASVEQSRALLYSTQLSIPPLKSQIRTQENAICILLNRDLGTIERASIDNQKVATKLDYGVPAQLLSKRPDVKQAELSLLAAYAATDAAEASFYPSLNISSASFGFASGSFSNFFKIENLAANIVASLTQPIFNKSQLTGNLKIAKAQQEEALLAFRSTVISAGQEVSDILYNYEASLGKNDYRNKQISSLANAVDYTQELLIAGEAYYTEVLSAQQDLLSAQLSRIDDKLEQLNYGVNLYKALGGGTH
ncbi:RND efflux system, outer membrane lipoprotein, NodT family [Chloroherpeton thalassium ATCC 35110]|uniref:RND efflux system, outer membrane lipoprotein, NodT family n=1 Tax=Chloroherpeton thalassium (strain ATCC 35110 / GB-78) TaxID=517418 RepID=B3QT37_CHLT3|nr:TolC family protein [Chloroherpeton thalassium]ACF14136.1 RND efflux system, outer membrane lipoprotein, NodT family [Chloroherpeton thalassium ATCC 35110]